MNKRLSLLIVAFSLFATAWPNGNPFPPAVGWSTNTNAPGAPDGQNEQGYAMGRDPSVKHNSRSSYTIKSLTADKNKWRSVTQAIRADAYRGRRIRLRGYVKAKGVSTGAGIWMRVDGIHRQQEFDNMGNRALGGDTDWAPCSVVLDVPKDAVVILYGAFTVGIGQMWVSDLSIEPVSTGVPSTAIWSGPDYSHDPTTPRNPDFEAAPLTDSKLDIPGWTSSIGEWDDQLRLNAAVTHNGKPSAEMHPAKGGWNAVSLWQEIKAAPYRGKKLEYRVFVKTDGIVSGGPMLAIPGGGQWLVADIPKFLQQGKNWVEDKREWKPVSVVCLVPDWANCIQVGVQLNSSGHVWVSDASFRVVPDSRPVTYAPKPQKLYTPAQIKTFLPAPTNLNFAR